MLNGKFFTGLPPKMMEDRNSSARNRLESHFFWPDDTQAVSAVETRVRRRASLNLEPTERPRLQPQVSLGGACEVDTKQRFHKEFAKSSIQFYDDIPEEVEAASRYGRRAMPRTGRSLKQEIAAKPTATKLALPENVMDGEYRSAKKKQAFNSKIQFYDFAEEDLNKQNNARQPKMDMNNKKEVERNTKNSPKLQVKRNVRHLSGDEERRNNIEQSREQYTPERCFENGSDNEHITQQRIIKNPVFEGTQYKEARHYETARQQSPRRNIRANKNNNFSNSDMYLAYGRGDIEHEPNYDEDRYETNTHSNNYAAGRNSAQQILKNTSRVSNNFFGGVEEDFLDLEQLDYGLRNMRLHANPEKHINYRDDVFENDLLERQHHSDDGMTTSTTTHVKRISTAAHSNKPNTKTTNATNMRAGSNQRQQFTVAAANAPDYAEQATEVLSQYMETGRGAAKKALNNYNSSNHATIYNNNTNNYNNNNNNKQLPSQTQTPSPLTRRKITPKMSTTSSATDAEAAAAAAAADAKKHLRSSICFYDGVIVADNGNATNTPTSSGTQRRNARSSATQRVSVGLPD